MDFQQLSAQSTAFSITDRIDNWTQEVAKTRRERCLRTKPVHYALRQHNHGIPAKLSKQVLDVTAPAFKRKRKGIMSENDDVEAPKKKRGRPARGSKPATQAPATAAYNNEAPLATPPLEPTPSLPSRRKASPRNNAKYIHQPIASTNINVRYLRLCHPRLHLKSLQDAKLACAVPQSVLELHNRLQSLELGQIPSELKARCSALTYHLSLALLTTSLVSVRNGCRNPSQISHSSLLPLLPLGSKPLPSHILTIIEIQG